MPPYFLGQATLIAPIMAANNRTEATSVGIR